MLGANARAAGRDRIGSHPDRARFRQQRYIKGDCALCRFNSRLLGPFLFYRPLVRSQRLRLAVPFATNAIRGGLMSDLSSRQIHERFLRPSRSALIQFVRYACVGGVAFLFDFGTLWAATELLGLHYLISSVLGFCVGLLVNYWLATRWVFEPRKRTNASVQFAIFALVGVVGVGLNSLSIWTLTEWLGLHYLGSKLVATGLVYIWNFSIRKALLF